MREDLLRELTALATLARALVKLLRQRRPPAETTADLFDALLIGATAAN